VEDCEAELWPTLTRLGLEVNVNRVLPYCQVHSFDLAQKDRDYGSHNREIQNGGLKGQSVHEPVKRPDSPGTELCVMAGSSIGTVFPKLHRLKILSVA
jgi:hypothetical protein